MEKETTSQKGELMQMFEFLDKASKSANAIVSTQFKRPDGYVWEIRVSPPGEDSDKDPEDTEETEE